MYFFRKRRTLRQIKNLDQQIFAYESGADKVTSISSDTSLDGIISFKGWSPSVFHRPKDVLVEMHDQYKAYFFVHSPRFSIFLKPLNGLMIQFKNFSMPNFLATKDSPPTNLDPSWRKLNLKGYRLEFTPGLHVYGDPNDERDVWNFWKKSNQLKKIFEMPGWKKMWVSRNFMLLYFEADRSGILDLKKEMFWMDEWIADVILGEAGEFTDSEDPAADIRLLKDQERGANRGDQS